VGRGKHRRKAGQTQTLANVQWAPCHQPGWLLEIAQHLGYVVKTVTIEAQPASLLPGLHKPCEYCTLQQHQDGADPRVECDTCLRQFHLQCLRDQGLPEPTTVEGAGSYTCHGCATHHTGSNAGPGSSTGPTNKSDATPMIHCLHRIEWQDSLEPAAVVQKAGTEQARAQLAALLTPPAHPTKKSPAICAQVEARQPARYPDGRLYDVTIGQQCRKQLLIHPQPINPHTDIAPTCKTEVIVRPVLTSDSNLPRSSLRSIDRACIYQADGRCTHVMQPQAAAVLQQRFLHAQAKQPHLFDRMQAGTFEQELQRLLTRYTSGNVIAEKPIQHRDQQSLPHELSKTLHRLIGSTTERLASPLNVADHTATYWSLHERDQLFGAHWNAYNVKWTGSSVVVPELDSAAADQAVHWALKSAIATAEPTLSLLVLPSYGRTGAAAAFMRRVRANPKYCKHILTLPQTSVAWAPPGNALQVPVAKCKWNMLVIAVGNAEGYNKHLPYWTPGWQAILLQDVKKALLTGLRASKLPRGNYIESPGAAWWNAPPQEQQITEVDAEFTHSEHASRRFKTRPIDHTRAPRTAALPDIVGVSDMSGAVQVALVQLRNLHTRVPPLIHNWQDFVYTDGSVLKERPYGSSGIGAAVYIPGNAKMGRQEKVHKVPCLIEGQEHEPAAVNTINRAELAGILVALQATLNVPRCNITDKEQAQPTAIHIATDSLSSLYQISKFNTHPQDMKEHRHLHLIREINQLVAASPVPIHVWKVKSHSGIIGNEIADRAAVSVAKGTDKTSATEASYMGDHSQSDNDDETEQDTSEVEDPLLAEAEEWPCHVASNTRGDMYWPYTRTSTSQTDKATGQTTQTITQTPFANLAETLKQHMHKHRKLGGSDTTTVYFNSWQRLEKDIHQKYSHKFMTSSKVQSTVRKRAIQYRYGLLPAQKLMHRYKKSDTSLCPLCGKQDGGHHAVSACERLSSSVTLRHNDAGTLIVEAIANGSKGGHLLATDVGWRRRHLIQEGQPLPSAATTRHIPVGNLPTTIPLHVRQQLAKHSIPDALMYHCEGGTREYTIVEIKYCRDTRPEDQQARAEAQHTVLKEAIEQHDNTAKVTLVTLMLGVSGVIYKSMAAALEEKLGVTGDHLRSLLTKLHFAAIDGMDRVWRQRWAMISGSQDREGTTKTQTIPRTTRRRHLQFKPPSTERTVRHRQEQILRKRKRSSPRRGQG